MKTTSKLDDIVQREEAIRIEKGLALQKAFESSDVNEIMKAQQVLKTIEKRQEVDFKSILVDPFDLSSAFGYKQKPFQLSYEVLRAMSRAHIIKSIIETRKEQVSAFCEPQYNKYSTGFVIQKKQTWRTSQEKEKKVSKQEQARIDAIYDFIMNCGTTGNVWSQDTFDVFISKIISDSLTLDQATFEIVRNRRGEIATFFATDAATYRLADSYEQDDYKRNEVEVSGYTPLYVQIYQNKVLSEFYPWELGFGVRNPSTDIRLNGYGKSELEDMIQTVTALLNADYYNANFFKVGSAPKGILRYSGNINQNTVEDFRQQWLTQVAGVMNMHKIPLINADKLDFINTQQSNKDMEFSRYQEFLIKVSCAMYKIDPSEIGFPMQGSADSHAMFEGSNEARLKYSKDKGLKPLLKRLQFWINKYLVSQIDPEYEFRFVGIDGEVDSQTELDNDIKQLSNFSTLNEIRAKRDLPPLPQGDVPLNPTYLQAVAQASYGDPAANQAVEDGFEDQGDEGNDRNASSDDNPFTKALQNDLEKIFNEND